MLGSHWLSWEWPVELHRMLDFLLRMGVAVAAAGIIGLERELHGRAAGFRTHVLVALGACVIMIGAGEMYLLLPPPHNSATMSRLDPGRVVQGIITGIGFLGAGVIVKFSDNRVRGLTTAASLWMVAAIGTLAGGGMILLAGMSAAVGWIVLVVFRWIEKALPSEIYETLSVRTKNVDTGYQAVTTALKEIGAKVQSSRMSRNLEEGILRVDMTIVFRKGLRKDRGAELVNVIAKLDGITRVEWHPGQE